MASQGFEASSTLRVDATFSDGSVIHGAGVWTSQQDVVTAADLVWQPGLGAATSIVVEPGLDLPNGFPSVVAPVDSWRYFPTGAQSATSAQADFALLHVPNRSTLAPQASSYFTEASTSVFTSGNFFVLGYPGGGDGLVGQTLILSQDPNTATLTVQGPALDAGFTGAAVFYRPPGIRGINFDIAGVVTTAGTVAEFSWPIFKQIRGWITDDAKGGTPPAGGTAETIPPLMHAITADTGASGVNPAEAALVDAFSYKSNNPDVVAAGMDPAMHFALYGWHENRAPDPLFDPAWYLQHNPDVAAAGIDPLLHYALYGWKEGRDPSASFSTKTYLADNADVQKIGMNPLQHYLYYGVDENRTGTPVG